MQCYKCGAESFESDGICTFCNHDMTKIPKDVKVYPIGQLLIYAFDFLRVEKHTVNSLHLSHVSKKDGFKYLKVYVGYEPISQYSHQLRYESQDFKLLKDLLGLPTDTEMVEINDVSMLKHSYSLNEHIKGSAYYFLFNNYIYTINVQYRDFPQCKAYEHYFLYCMRLSHVFQEETLRQKTKRYCTENLGIVVLVSIIVYYIILTWMRNLGIL